jgi:hypothetical protein
MLDIFRPWHTVFLCEEWSGDERKKPFSRIILLFFSILLKRYYFYNNSPSRVTNKPIIFFRGSLYLLKGITKEFTGSGLSL